MKTLSSLPAALRGLLAFTFAGVALVAGCGGVGSGGTGGFASGPITGFGSVIVGGVRFDDSGAEVEDGDGARRSRDELRLGMTVEVDSSAITAGSSGTNIATATANRIRFESELSGLVGTVDVAGGSFTLLGQRVTVDDSTVFDDRYANGLASLATGQPVEVYAVFDSAAQRYRATRVEPAALATLALGLRLRGPVAQLDAAAQTLRVGTVSYSFAGASSVPAGLGAGQFVRLRLEADLLPVPRWVVKSFGTALRPLADADGVKVEGLITAYTSAASFSVGGRLVDASGMGGMGGGGMLAVGVRVEVEGTLRGGLLRATSVVVKSDREVHDRGFELTGAITAVNTAQGSFVVRSVTVNTGRSDLRYEDGTAAQLVVGRNVEVRGLLAADRHGLDATRIRFR